MTSRRRSTAVNFTAAIRYAREWEVPVILRPEVVLDFEAPPGADAVTHTGPVAGGIHWPTRTLVWPVDDIDRWDIAAFIHELSHILVDIDPNEVSEIDGGVVAMDHAAFRFLGASDLWHEWMKNFQTDRGAWSKVSSDFRNDLLVDSELSAQRDGLLDLNWRPTFRRIQRKTVGRAA